MFLFLAVNLAWANCPADAQDPYESNDSFSSAIPLGLTEHLGLGVCPAHADYFTISPAQGATLSANVQYDESLGDLNLSLFSISGQVISESVGNSGLASLEVNVAIGGDHILMVEQYSGSADGMVYDLTLSETAVLDCQEDIYEPNQTPTSAALLSTGQHADLYSCLGDSDWYKIPLNVSELISVDVLFAHAEGDIDISLIDPNGQQVESSLSLSDNESLSFLPIVPGDYLLHVQMLSDTDAIFGVDYAIDLSLTQMAVCTDDIYEENDLQSLATVMDMGFYEQLMVCDDDWYGVELEDGEALTILLNFEHSQGDIDISLYGPQGTWLDSASGSGDIEEMTYLAEVGGFYTFNVRLFNDDADLGNSYSMNLSVQEANQESASEPSSEPSSEPVEPSSEPEENGKNQSGCQAVESIDFSLVLLAFALLLIHSRNRQEITS